MDKYDKTIPDLKKDRRMKIQKKKTNKTKKYEENRPTHT